MQRLLSLLALLLLSPILRAQTFTFTETRSVPEMDVWEDGRPQRHSMPVVFTAVPEGAVVESVTTTISWTGQPGYTNPLGYAMGENTSPFPVVGHWQTEIMRNYYVVEEPFRRGLVVNGVEFPPYSDTLYASRSHTAIGGGIGLPSFDGSLDCSGSSSFMSPTWNYGGSSTSTVYGWQTAWEDETGHGEHVLWVCPRGGPRFHCAEPVDVVYAAGDLYSPPLYVTVTVRWHF